MEKTKVLVVVGPTASGKTKLSIELAKLYNGQIISADSMQIYKHMDIATAKPTVHEMGDIKHHLIDFLDLDKSFSVSDYVSLAKDKIEEIKSEGCLPIIVGGTGLYIDSLINNVQFTDTENDYALRDTLYEEYKSDGGEALYKYLSEVDPETVKEIHRNNMVRVVRAVEIFKTTGIKMSEHKKMSTQYESPYDACIIGLNFKNRQSLYDRINLRVDMMMEDGLLEEAKKILGMTTLKTALNAIGYKELKPYIDNEESLEVCLDKIKQESRRYAKRQLTWFRRNEKINWIMVDDNVNFDNILNCSKNIIEISWSLC